MFSCKWDGEKRRAGLESPDLFIYKCYDSDFSCQLLARKICFILAIHSSLEGVKGTDKRLQELSSLWREGTETAELCALITGGKKQKLKNLLCSQSKAREMAGRGPGTEGAMVICQVQRKGNMVPSCWSQSSDYQVRAFHCQDGESPVQVSLLQTCSSQVLKQIKSEAPREGGKQMISLTTTLLSALHELGLENG